MTTNNVSNDIEIQFLYFDGCPNAAQSRKNLRAALDELGVDVYTGSVPNAFEFSCRTFDIDGERTGSVPASVIRERIVSALGR